MKKEELTALGLTEEQIDGVQALNGKDVNAEKTKTENVQKEVTTLQTQLSETQETLKKFDGVDVEAYKTQITELTTKIDTQNSEYEKEKQEREFGDWLTNGLKGTGVKSIKALQAELGDKLETLKTSKNRDDDLKTILESNKETYSWMIPSEEPLDNPVKATGAGSTVTTLGKNESLMRAAMGLKPIQ